MAILSRETGITITTSVLASQATVSGSFTDLPIDYIIRMCARMNDLEVVETSSGYYIGAADKTDVVHYVMPPSPCGSQELLTAIRPLLSPIGSIQRVGESLVISDAIDNVVKIVAICESLDVDSSKTYIAEVYFLRVKNSDFMKLSADLEINQVDIFGNAWNIEELFKCCLDGDLGRGGNSVDQRPVIYLSEGKENKFNVGSEIIKEQYNYSEGVSTVSGYEKFSDGMTLVLKANKTKGDRILVDFDLTISTFDGSDKSSIPKSDKSTLKTDGLICEDGRVHYVGSLKKYGKTTKFGLLSWDNERSSDVLTIWMRIREVQ